ncbi:MAG: hypothetical protein ABSH51_31140 [Solirubrobacteraceae bacterium]|jgi:hypothetical protein
MESYGDDGSERVTGVGADGGPSDVSAVDVVVWLLDAAGSGAVGGAAYAVARRVSQHVRNRLERDPPAMYPGLMTIAEASELAEAAVADALAGERHPEGLTVLSAVLGRDMWWTVELQDRTERYEVRMPALDFMGHGLPVKRYLTL